MDNELEGRFWINKAQHNFLGKGRIELLLCIEESGSITKAAKMMKMSYKAAWDSIDAINNLSEYPLVMRIKGGKGGGGTELTSYAKELIQTYKILSEEHKNFLENLSKRVNEKDGHFHLLDSLNIRLSARNQLKVKVSKIHKGALESEIFLKLNDDEEFMAIITNDSFDMLELKINSSIYAIFKANAVLISRDLKLQKSDRNRFIGTIDRISKGNFDAEVVVALKNTNSICSTMPMDILNELNIKNGDKVAMFCKPNAIILGIW